MFPPLAPFTGYPPQYHQIYVGDLPMACQEETLVQYFSQYGPIMNVKMGANKASKKYAFISFTNQDSGFSFLISIYRFDSGSGASACREYGHRG